MSSSELQPADRPVRTRPGVLRPASRASPPRLPAALLEWLLGSELGPLLRGDLDEEFRAHIRPERGRVKAALWYWRQVAASLLALRSEVLGRPDTTAELPSLSRRTLPPPPEEHPVHQILPDLRFAFRSLRKRPGTTAAAVLTLALGIGATTAIWSAVDTVLLEPLPYAREAELVRLGPDQLFPFPLADARYIQEHSTRLGEVAAWGRSLFVLHGDGEPEEVRGAVVFDNHFTTLGA
ncbi:MAG: hypothetical protein MI919_41515, partial [Holophagales bacterium]|nr:hypothetical protein [Holophagales bacterium]